MSGYRWIISVVITVVVLMLTAGVSAAQKSADEIAKELANPSSSLASYTFKNGYAWYDGNLPGADNQSHYSLLFQPSLPFPLANGDKVIWRPAVPFIFDQPVFDAGTLRFDGVSGVGDIGFDLVYAPDLGKTILAYGVFSTLPTATDRRLGHRRWTLGPELLVGQLGENTVTAILANHQWDIAGPGNADVSLTTVQPIAVYILDGGWTVGSSPSITYDWESKQWTVPLQLNASKTIVIGDTPWKFAAEINYYIEKPQAFGREWFVTFNITPVLPNPLAGLFKR